MDAGRTGSSETIKVEARGMKMPEEAGAGVLPPRREDSIRNSVGIRLQMVRRGRRELLLQNGPFLLIAVGVLAVSRVAQSLDSSGHWFLPDCLFRRITGLPCLACGLTRSFSRTAHGDLTEAFSFHLLGPLLFLMTAIAGLYFATTIATGHAFSIESSRAAKRLAGWSIFLLFVLCWILKLILFKSHW